MLSRAAVHNDAGILNQTEHSKSAKITRYLHMNETDRQKNCCEFLIGLHELHALTVCYFDHIVCMNECMNVPMNYCIKLENQHDKNHTYLV